MSSFKTLLVVLFAAFGIMSQASAGIIRGSVSFYGTNDGFAGKRTAAGDCMDPKKHTIAHKTLPLGSEVVVYYEGVAVKAVVNDRGPYHGNRVADLSPAIATKLGMSEKGVVNAMILVLGTERAITRQPLGACKGDERRYGKSV